MSDLRDQIRRSGREELGRVPVTKQSKKRSKPNKTRQEIESAKDAKHGKPRTFRLSDETISMIDDASEQHNVQKSSLVEFLIRAALYQVNTGKIALPVQESDDKPRKVDMP